MTDPQLEFEFQRQTKWGKGTLLAKMNGDVIHTDELKLTDATARERFAKRLCEKRKGIDKDLVMDSLDSLAAREAADANREGQDDESEPQVAHYESTKRGIIWLKSTKEGPMPVQLTNFQAWIAADIILDDGVETTHSIEVTAEIGDEKIRFTIPASMFPSMNWITQKLGSRAILSAGFSCKDHARAAIQTLSSDIDTKHIFTHTGWRNIDDKVWIFLHAGGSIGPNGPIVPITAEGMGLMGELQKFSLPVPPEGEDLKDAITACLDLLNLAPPPVAVPLIAATFRAVLGGADLSIHVAGATGVFKTEVVALFQSFFGAELDSRNLPGSWSSTDNSLEELGFRAKDVLIVIDDFAPSGSTYDVQRYHKKADRVIRAQGNRSGRGRCRPDGTLKNTRAPRCLFLSTGEDIPAGQSLRARMMILEFQKGDVDPQKLSACQQASGQGAYARAMAGFLRWMSGQYESLATYFHDRLPELRDEATKEGQHRRTPDIVAQLYGALEIFADFAVEVGALESKEATSLKDGWWSALGEMAEAQEHHQHASEPTAVFIRLVVAALASGEAHLANRAGEIPAYSPEAVGWRKQTIGSDDEWRPQGRRIGWIDGDDLYLIPEASFKTAQRMAQDTDRIPVHLKTLTKRLAERGHLVSRDEKDKRNTVRRELQGARRHVLHLMADVVLESGLSGQPGLTDGSRVTQSAPAENTEPATETGVMADTEEEIEWTTQL